MKDVGPDLCMNSLVLFYLTASGDLTPEAFVGSRRFRNDGMETRPGTAEKPTITRKNNVLTFLKIYVNRCLNRINRCSKIMKYR